MLPSELVGFFPFAVRTCPKLEAPENGHINCSTPDIAYKSVCFVTCNEGYEIEGNTKLTCLGTSQWDSKEPKCVGKYPNHLCLFMSRVQPCLIGCHMWETLRALISGEANTGVRTWLWIFYAALKSWGGRGMDIVYV